jgi:hypothetical protein
MSGKEALMDIYHRFKYGRHCDGKYYNDNEKCPQQMWSKTGRICGNCADISRLVKCVGEVHGMKIGIKHGPSHYYNLVEVNGKTYKFDCCFQKDGTIYGGEICNTLTKRGGPWS